MIDVPVKGPKVLSMETRDWPRPLTAPMLCGCAEFEIKMNTDTKVISDEAWSKMIKTIITPYNT